MRRNSSERQLRKKAYVNLFIRLGKTNKKSDFSKGVGRGNPPRPLRKKTLFFYKSGFFNPKIGDFFFSKSVSIKIKVAWKTKPLV